ncbi:MAG TPA: SPFH domain-containing protein [Pirellulales bacterium]|nr:SPFH domain-containing protein [Pirellulales bacterium]
MLGIKFLKVRPTTYVMHFKNGRVVREGAGRSFLYFAPGAEIVQISLASIDVPFVFNGVTADFQDAAIQGELTYRVTDPKRLAAVLDFSVDNRGHYRSEDPTKLNDRLIHAAQTIARGYTQRKNLRDVLVGSAELVSEISAGLQQSAEVAMLGVEILGVSVLSIRSNPEMAKALQAAAREALMREADEAIYARRNAAVEQERAIRENELLTEIAVEQKKRQVRETQMAAEIAVEEQKAVLVDHRVQNERKEADARAHAIQATLAPLKEVDWRTLVAAAAGGADPKMMIALAFRDIADSAGKIGNLNISPELLSSLLGAREG